MHEFLVSETSVCQDCNNKVADRDCILCRTCKSHFHAVCPSAPDKETQICSKTFLSTFLTQSANKPNFSWECNACKTKDEIDNVATLKNMISKIEKNHSEQISKLTEMVSNLVKIISGNSGENELVKVSGEDSVWGNTNNVQKIRSSLLAKPDDKGKKIKPADVQKIATDKGIPVDSVFQRDNGDLFVNLPDEGSRDAIEQHLAESHSNKVVKLTSKLPTISILDITQKDMKNENDQDLTTEQIKISICKQNKMIEKLVEDGSQFEVVYCKPPPNGKKFYTVAARISPNIRDALRKMKMKIHFGTSIHSVVDRFHVRRCNLCQGLGHYAKYCSPDTALVCGYCSESHKSEECPHKNKDHTHHKCSNCNEAGLTSVGHPTFWQKCPSYLSAQQKLAKTIGYNYDNLN